MKKIFSANFLLLIIILVAAFLRFTQLGFNPPSLTWDEAAWGYNAYSLGVDGKDEFGKFLPITNLESFGDFKPPLYAYLDVLPVKLLGLNEVATRFPSALFGTLTVLVTFFLVRRIFYSSKQKDIIALCASLFLAISPWHILLSRAAFEANVASFFLVFGIWMFLVGVGEVDKFKFYNKLALIASAISFVLTMYTFNTERIVTPIIVVLFAILFRKKLWAIRKYTFMAILVGIVMFLPLVTFLFSPQAELRFKEVNIFSNSDTIELANQEIANDGNVWWSKIMHNRRLLYSMDYLKHYFDNLSPLFLFTKGDGNPKFSVQDVGQMYIWDAVFLIAGILFIIRKKEGYWYLIPLWLLIGIIPSATAQQTPHALRIEASLPTFQILAAYGFVEILLKVNRYKKLFAGGLLLLLVLNFMYFYHNYFSNYPWEYSGEWQYGYKQSVDYVYKNMDNYKQVYVTTALGRPYVYYLFYGKVDPKYFRSNAVINRDPFGFVTVSKIGKLNFVDNPISPLLIKKQTLYVTDKWNIPVHAKILKTFYLLNGDISLMVFTYD
jgi:4-amino-4-deoxy-L-arabinose transferase-like glycosyltransferase